MITAADCCCLMFCVVAGIVLALVASYAHRSFRGELSVLYTVSW